MKQLLYLSIAITISFVLVQRDKNKSNDTHIWVLNQDSAFEISLYNIARCKADPNKYCSYWTTMSFPFHSMPINLFQALLSDGYFTGHDYNRSYVY